MPSVRKTPSLSPETRLRVLHEQRDKRARELARIGREFARKYPSLYALDVHAWRALIAKEREKLARIDRAILKFAEVIPATERQMTFGWE